MCDGGGDIERLFYFKDVSPVIVEAAKSTISGAGWQNWRPRVKLMLPLKSEDEPPQNFLSPEGTQSFFFEGL